MTEISTTTTLGQLVTRAPGAARVLERFGLDYCCGGRAELGDACADRGIDTGAVLSALTALPEEPEPGWASRSPSSLVDHIEATHHAYLHTELPRLSALAAKVAGVHAARHPELVEVRALYAAVRAELEPHLLREERVLFPMIRELDGAVVAPTFHCGSLRNPISVMMADHDRAGDLLAELRRLTDGYQVPADGCASYRALYEGLAELEADTHLHVHKENNVLFPAVVQLESGLPTA
jgi:regulator of cell morphogenesis and NO signaling